MASSQPSIANIVHDILGLSTSAADKYWRIEKRNEEKSLYLCHYISDKMGELNVDPAVPQKDKEIIRNTRGVIVSFARVSAAHPGTIISRSFGYTPVCTVAGALPESKVEFKDYNGLVHKIDFSDPETSVALCLEGTIVKVSKYNNEFFMTSAHSFDITRSHWGNSPQFLKCYQDLGGPAPETLFDATKPSSNITHLFMLVHPTLQVATRLDVGNGYLAYLGHAINNSFDDLDPEKFELTPATLPSSVNSVDYHAADGSFVVPVHPPTDFTDPEYKQFIFAPCRVKGSADALTLANKILTQGLSDLTSEEAAHMDPRLTPGEACIVIFKNEQGQQETIKLASVAYNWRSAMSGNNPNRYNQFVSYRSYSLPSFLNDPKVYQPYEVSTGMKAAAPGGECLFTPSELVEIFNGDQDRVYGYEQLFPTLAAPTPEELVEFGRKYSAADLPTYKDFTEEKFTSYACVENDVNSFRNAHLANIAVNFALAVSAPNFTEATTYLRRLSDDIENTSNFLCHNFKLFKGIPKFNPRTRTYMISLSNYGYVDHLNNDDPSSTSLLTIPAFTSRRDGITKLNPGGQVIVRLFTTAVSGQRAPQTLEFAQGNLRNLIQKERGGTLYSLITAVKAFITQQTAAPVEASATKPAEAPKPAAIPA